ncbi:MAG: DNA-binding protein [Rhodobacteraceae bacterium]|nr:DNA-binding protein [Paracoccaceae bacterium]
MATTRKTTTARKTTPKKTAQTPAAPEPTVVSIVEPAVSEPDLKKRELIDMVVERSGVKKKDAKPAIEAMLAVLGEAIASGRELNLQPLGKLRINRATEHANGRVIVCKLRQSAKKDEKGSEEPLAESEN